MKLCGIDASSSVQDGVDQRDTDCTAQIAHQVEETAGARHLHLRQRSERETGRGQKTKHDRGAADDLGPEHFTKVGISCLKHAEAKPEREDAKADSGQNPWINAPFRDRSFAIGCVLSFCLGIGLYGSVYLIPVFLAFVEATTPSRSA